jgi:hypothetical protein|tara:strand:- start:77 stop:283 length:207 start_codon:yes stop_codon:yes gene_type:complete
MATVKSTAGATAGLTLDEAISGGNPNNHGLPFSRFQLTAGFGKDAVAKRLGQSNAVPSGKPRGVEEES